MTGIYTYLLVLRNIPNLNIIQSKGRQPQNEIKRLREKYDKIER